MGTFRKVLLFLSGMFTGISGTCLVLSKVIANDQGLTLREFWGVSPDEIRVKFLNEPSDKASEEIGMLENALDKNDVGRVLYQPRASATTFGISDKLSEESQSSDTVVVFTEKIPDSDRFYSRISAEEYEEWRDNGGNVYEFIFELSTGSYYWTHTYNIEEHDVARGYVGGDIDNWLGDLEPDYLDNCNDDYIYLNNELYRAYVSVEIVDEFIFRDDDESDDFDDKIVLDESNPLHRGFFETGYVNYDDLNLE